MCHYCRRRRRRLCSRFELMTMTTATVAAAAAVAPNVRHFSVMNEEMKRDRSYIGACSGTAHCRIPRDVNNKPEKRDR